MIVEIPVTFEKMQWQDVPDVMGVERRSFSLPWSANTYRHEILENNNAHYYVLRHRPNVNGRRAWLSRLMRRAPLPGLIGYGGFWLIIDEAHISTIAVDASWRGRGLGEYLLASMIEQAIALNSAQITLEVRESNEVAQALYRKYGFAITGRRPRYYQDNQENAHVMGVSGVNTPEYRRMLQASTSALVERLARSKPAAPLVRGPAL